MATLLKKPSDFSTFGPSILARQTRGQLRGSDLPEDRLEARRMLREKCPLEPGVYGWLDDNRQLVYVGKSKSLRKRLLSYFAKTPSDKKAERIRRHSCYLVWEPISCELLALIREQELIHRWRPEFNSQGQPTRTQPAFLCVGGSPAANARLVRRLTPKSDKAYGPIRGTGQLRESIIALNHVFHLRDCPDQTKFQFSNQQLLFGERATAKCIRHELGTCPGPCVGHCSTSDYQSNVNRMLEFLDGRNKNFLAGLETQMQQAAADAAFERAAIIRDNWEQLTWLDRRLAGLRRAYKHLNGVLPVQARRNRTAWLVLKGGRIVLSAKLPTEPEKAAKLLCEIENSASRSSELPANILEMNLQLIVISWLKKYPEMRKQMIRFPDAISHLAQIAEGQFAGQPFLASA